MNNKLEIKMEIFEEDNLYVALCPELNISSYGESLNEAKKSLLEAVEAFIVECIDMGTLEDVLEEAGFTHDNQTWRYRQAIQEEHLALAI